MADNDRVRRWWGPHIAMSAVAAVPIVGLVIMAALIIVYAMRVFAISVHRARKFMFIAVYAVDFFTIGLIN